MKLQVMLVMTVLGYSIGVQSKELPISLNCKWKPGRGLCRIIKALDAQLERRCNGVSQCRKLFSNDLVKVRKAKKVLDTFIEDWEETGMKAQLEFGLMLEIAKLRKTICGSRLRTGDTSMHQLMKDLTNESVALVENTLNDLRELGDLDAYTRKCEPHLMLGDNSKSSGGVSYIRYRITYSRSRKRR